MNTTFGIMCAALIYFLFQFFVGKDKLLKFKFIWAPRDKDFRVLLKRAIPILFSASVVQINVFILNAFIISLPGDGNAFALRNASTTWQLPYGIFAVAIGNVMLPSLAALYGKKDYKGASELLGNRLRKALFLTIPSAVLMLFLHTDVIKAIYQWNSSYTDEDAKRAGILLAGYSVAIVTHTIVFIMNQAFYAIGKTKVPLFAGCVGLITNPLICFMFIPHFGVIALTLAYSFTSVLQMLILSYLYARNQDLRPRGFFKFFLKEIIIIILMVLFLGLISFRYQPVTGKMYELLSLATRVAACLTIYLVGALFLRMPEADEWLRIIRSRFAKSK